MAFMQRQITRKLDWYRVETTSGTCFLAKEDIGNYPDADAESVSQGVYPLAVEALQQYCEGDIESWETIRGYGARLSAPGYLDCTDWSVFDTPELAEGYLDEYYPDEDGQDKDGQDEDA